MNKEEIRLDQTKKVFDTLAELISKNQTCTYRCLIYDLLGFDAENYAELMSGLTITNALVEREEQQEEIDRLNNIINELTDLILLKKARAENEKDYSKYYIEGFTKALKITHSTPDGIMLETVKSTTIAICKEFLDKLKALKEEK